METHEKIRLYREINQWSQEDMANQLHMSKNGYAKIEQGKTRLNTDRLKQIANVFGISVTELVSPNSIVVLGDGNSHNNINSYYGQGDTLEHENDKLKLIIEHQKQTIDRQQAQIETLEKLVNALQK
ncbi:transcriptional regulator, y4mF family [Moraxella caprae]|uniref:Transcriptional regulator, y4mF family n=1 Tax=Moraxella caprae TaxID=90240 RepID=A0A378R1P1_9GAMM|nr:helix-turn-helix transcriptional regulator [Moraxella caprae]STZ09104.1 transcriptional regulator, y4mF family [Moraxella caprae]